jgi:pyrroloquinoline-quinone synthase
MEDFWKQAQRIIEENSLLNHPFYQAWSMGTLALEDLRFYAGQYYKQEAMFPRYLSSIHSHCPNAAARQELLSNLIEEEKGPENHSELWLRFGESLGMPRADIETAKATPETEECVRSFQALTQDAQWTNGVSALYAYEVQQPSVACTKIKGLKEFYGINSETGLKFFKVHEEVDQWHSASEKGILEKELKENASLAPDMLYAIRSSSQALLRLLDGVCREREIATNCSVKKPRSEREIPNVSQEKELVIS